MQISIDATVHLVEAALAVLPEVPRNLNRPHVDVNAPHLSSWPEESRNLWKDNPNKAIVDSFCAGEIFLNLNVPRDWNGNYSTTRLGMRWYRSAITFVDETSTFKLGAARIDVDAVENGDVDSDVIGVASVTVLPSWPQTHPLDVDPGLLAWSLANSKGGIPCWLR